MFFWNYFFHTISSILIRVKLIFQSNCLHKDNKINWLMDANKFRKWRQLPTVAMIAVVDVAPSRCF